jgi:hypothetical protein
MVPSELLKRLFGNRYGDNGCGGYGWQNCTVEDVVARIKYLHPILYQHGDDELPTHVKIRFAEGITREYEEGEGFVDRCAFGAEVNKRQRNRYVRDRKKLEALRNTLAGAKAVDVQGKEWRSIKVEPGTEIAV